MKKICYVTTLSVSIRAFFIPQLKYLSEHGYDVSVICSPDKELQKELGDKIRYIPVSIARGISPTTLLSSVLSLRKVFLKEKFDIVQYSTPNAAFCGAIAAKAAGIKIRNYHLMGLRYLGFSGILKCVFKILEKLTCKLSTNIECVSKSNLEMSVSEKLFPENKGVVVWNGSSGGVDMTRFDASKRQEWRLEVRKALGIDEEDFVFGFVGRITKDKGINELIAAYSGLDTAAKLLIIGDVESGAALDTELWESAVKNKNVIMIGFESDIEKYYSAMDVLVLPSYREGFGMVIAEAAAMGVPAIVSDIPGPIDVIDRDKTALTAKVKDAESLMECMERFLKEPQLSRQMSEACVEFIKNNFDSVRLCEKIYERKELLSAVKK